jgi:hypothetical protein
MKGLFLLGLAVIVHCKLGDIMSYIKLIDKLVFHCSNSISGEAVFFLVQAYARTQQTDKNLKGLNLSAKRNEVEMAWLKYDPALSVLKGNPEYKSYWLISA